VELHKVRFALNVCLGFFLQPVVKLSVLVVIQASFNQKTAAQVAKGALRANLVVRVQHAVTVRRVSTAVVIIRTQRLAPIVPWVGLKMVLAKQFACLVILDKFNQIRPKKLVRQKLLVPEYNTEYATFH
jgi:hypothetical protein